MQLTLTICAQDCSSPVDCYVKAIDMLNQDRADIRRFRENIETIIEEKNTEIKNSLDEKFKQKEQIWDKKNAEIQKKFENQITAFKTEINSLKSEILSLKSEIEAQNIHKHKQDNMYKEAIIYDDIILSLEKQIITKIGSPVGWNETSYRSNNPWNGRTLLYIGKGAQSNGNGIKTTVPEGYNVLWIRCTNNEWAVFRLMYLDGDKEQIGKFTCGHRSLNEISPDGGTPDSYNNVHMWTPIPIKRKGSIIVMSDVNSASAISGIAFGKNLWNHARNSAVAYHWKVNGGDDITWNSDNWNNDILGQIDHGKINEMIVPVAYSGKDKILYIVEHNNNWVGTMHGGVKVNGVSIERFRTTYVNPFSVHFNSKLYTKYIGALIPKELIKDSDIFVTVEIDMTKQNTNINFREMGTHDLE